MRNLYGTLAVVVWILFSGSFASATATLNYHGRIVKPNGLAFEPNSATIKIQIRSTGAEDCLMWEETYSGLDMSGTGGVFSLNLNSSTGVRTDGSGLTFAQVFGNYPTTTMTVPMVNCTGGSNVITLTSSSHRVARLLFKDSVMPSFEQTPDMAIAYVPFSMDSQKVGGFTPDNLLRVEDASGPQAAAAFSPVEFAELQALIGGSSGQYEKSGELNGQTIPALSNGNVLQWQGGAWTAVTPVTSESDPNTRAYAKADLPTCAANEFLQSTGANTWVCTGVTGAAGGTVTSITVGSGLVDGSGSTGTSILTTGTIALPDLITAGTGTKVTFDAKGRITSTTTLAEADIPNLTTAGKVSGDTITSGTIAGTTAINTSGNILGGEVSTSSLVLRDGDTNKITIQTPADVAANYVLTLPPDNGGAGEVLTTDGNGVLTWVPFSTGSVTSVSGTAPITVGGTAAAPVIAVNSATTTTTGVVTLAADGGTTASTVVQATDSRLTNSRAPTGTASGDLDGTYPGPTVAKIQGFAVDTATPLDTQVMRYTGGGTNKWAPAYINFADLKKADGTPQVVGATCTAGQTMIWSSITDLFTCTTISLTAAQISDVDTTLAKIGGNTVTGTMVLGANSTHNLQFETDGAARMTIDSSGNVGIGTTAPTSNFVVESDGSINSISSGAYGTGVWGQLLLFTKRGTQATPTATQSGDILGSINFQGHDTGGSNGAIIRGVAAAEWGTAGDSTDAPANIQFLTGPDGTQGPLERMVITSTGSVGIGTSAPGTSLDVVGAITSGPLGTASGETGQFILRELAANGTHSAKIRAPDSLAADYILTLPADDGNVGEVLTTNGSGVLTWSPASAATSVVANIGSAAAPSIAFSGDANTGIYSPGAEQVAIAANGAQIFNFSSGGMTSPTTGGGTVTTASGTASAPTFSFTGDEDTGWYRATANTLAAATDGTERVRIDSAGNVGIGINNPSAKLDVNKSIATDGTQQRATNVKMDVSAGTNITSSSFTGTNIDIATSAPGQISSVTGSEVWSRVNPAGGVALMRGYYANLYNYDAVPVDYWNGAELSLYNGGGGATNQMNGVNVNLSQNNSSTMNAAVGFLANINNNNSSTMNEAIGFRVEFANNANIGVGTGLYIDATGASVGRGIYQVGVADKNIFMGDIGVGTDTPTTKLDVAGAITSRPHGTATGETGQFIMRELAANGVNTATIRVPDSIAADYILTLPADDGNSGEVLTTNGSGVLTWAAAGSATSVAAGAGSAAAPSMSFSGDPNTGFYNTAADQIGVAANGAQIFNFSSSGLKSPTTGGATITTADGTAAAPTFSFTGDEDTGWFRPAADTLAASTAGTERVRIDSNGRVGIGTTSPAAKLDVMAYNINVGADWSTGTARTDATGKGGYVTFPHYTNAQAPITMIGSLNSATSNGVFIGGGTSNYNAATSISFYTAANSTTNTGTERMRIESSGHVGIGTTTPAQKLHVSGSDESSVLMLENTQSTTARYPNITLRNYAGSSGGYSGINMQLYRGSVSAPSAAQVGDILGNIAMWGYGTTGTRGAGGILMGADGNFSDTSSPGYMEFYTTPSGSTTALPRMKIDSSGNVGIGTSSPADLLHVNGSGSVAARISTASGASYLTFSNTTDAVINNVSNTNLVFTTNNAEKMRITASGNVGIGTTNPGWKMQMDIVNTTTNNGLTLNAYDNSTGFPAAQFRTFASRGTPGSPTALQANDFMGGVSGSGQWTGKAAGGFVAGEGRIGINFYASENWSSASNNGNIMSFSTTTTGSGTSAERMRIDANGNVGIGTGSAVNKLAVVAGADDWAATFYGLSNSNTVRMGTLSGVATIGANNNAGNAWADLSINPGGSTYFAVNAGNVGVGTASPGRKLTVSGAADGAIGVVNTGMGNSELALYDTTDGGFTLFSQDNYFRIGKLDTTGVWTSNLVSIDSSGNVGVGTTNPGTKLQVAGVISPSADNTYDLGTSALRFKDIYAANNVIQTSDARLKTDVKDSDLGLGFINNLRPVSYYWKEGDPKLHYGVIAQETEKALSDAKKLSGRENEVDNVIVTHDEKTDRYGVRYTELIAPIIKAIQELYNELMGHDSRLTTLEAKDAAKERSIASKADKTETDALKAETTNLKAENEKLKQENAEMKARLDKIEKMLNSK